MQLLLVGCGSMGDALRYGWQSESDINIHIVDPTRADIGAYSSINDLPTSFKPDVVIFAIKPQLMAEVAPLYRRYAIYNPVYISIAAGKAVAVLTQYLGDESCIIRAMPNLPATVGQGVTGVYSPKPLHLSLKNKISRLFNCVGQTLWLDEEDQINIVTALSGSGPAYFYRFVEALTRACQNLGGNAEMASQLARQTLVGAARLLEKSDLSATKLRQQVTSPGGTTAAALAVFDNSQRLDQLVEEAIAAAYSRAKELSQ